MWSCFVKGKYKFPRPRSDVVVLRRMQMRSTQQNNSTTEIDMGIDAP